MYMSLLILAAALAPQPQPQPSGQELADLESACYGWSGEAAYQQAHASGQCALLGMDPGERSAFSEPPQYPQLKRGGE